jgi:hypothetical protein
METDKTTFLFGVRSKAYIEKLKPEEKKEYEEMGKKKEEELEKFENKYEKNWGQYIQKKRDEIAKLQEKPKWVYTIDGEVKQRPPLTNSQIDDLAEIEVKADYKNGRKEIVEKFEKDQLKFFEKTLGIIVVDRILENRDRSGLDL